MARPSRTGGKRSAPEERKASSGAAGRTSLRELASVSKARRPGLGKPKSSKTGSRTQESSAPSETARLKRELKAARRESREALERQTATADVLKVISRSSVDLETVLDTLVQTVARLCRADQVYMFHLRHDLWHLIADCGLSVEARKFFQTNPFTPGRGATSGRAALERRAVHIPDVLQDPEYTLGEGQATAGYRTTLGIPLLRENALIGVYSLARTRVEPFTNKEIELATSFADQAVIAIENARLFEQVQAKTRELTQSLEYQTATSEVLNVISRSPNDLQPVLDTIVEIAHRLCGSEYALIMHRRSDGFYRIVAHANASQELLKWLEDNPVSPGDGSAVGIATIEKRTVHLHDSLADPRFTDRRRQAVSEARTMLAVPLLKDEDVIGVVFLARTDVEPFTDKQVELVTSFADQAVIAISNVRLFEEVQARTRDLQESLQQQTASADVLRVISSSPGELGVVFQALLANAVRLCDAKFGMLFLPEGNAFRAVEKWNLPPAYSEFLGQNAIQSDPKIPLTRAALTKQPVQVADILLDRSYLERHPGIVAVAENGGARTLLQVPMLREKELVGTIGIYRQEVRPFTEKQTALVQNFAAQAVIAIENASLIGKLRKRTDDLARSLEDLRAAQNRLVQTEKLASLGQLTAGIAHEIKNPLNFVNNFSALSAELVDEMTEVLADAGIEAKKREELDEIRQLLKSNLEKVVQHGKRADSIVKNMLLHSREGAGEHRPVEINALVEESLNLAYHGARAEKTDFNIAFERDFDPEAGIADVYPQEITRVLLNVISNGFYAAAMRRAEVGNDFEPKVWAATRDLREKVEIRIRDNGIGISDEVKDKIFNPFFTTKPAGEGTGLGLSMSHDIVVKQHSGTIEVETEVGAFTEFRIVLPRTGTLRTRSGEQE